jgi:predicted PurR-regulated permease PerM
VKEKTLKKYLALLIIILLAAIVLWALTPFINALLGGLMLAAILVKPHEYLTEKRHINRNLSSLLVMCLSIFVIIIPLFVLLGIVGNEIHSMVQNPGALISSIEFVDTMIPQADIQEKIQESIPLIGKALVKTVSGFLTKVGNIIFTLFIAYVLVYFLLSTPKNNRRVFLHTIIPFNKENSAKLIEKFNAITNTTLKTSGIIALIQGGLMGILFLTLGIPGAFTWAFFSAIVSFVPALGVFIVWMPAAILLAVQGNYTGALIMVIGGLFISTIDNFIRPRLQSKSAAEMHPLTSLIGVFMGLSAFGLIGLIVGPLLLTFLFMTIKMFKEEYVE